AIVFLFQAEDGIRDRNVTGVQTCALPISIRARVMAGSMRLRRFSPSPSLSGTKPWRGNSGRNQAISAITSPTATPASSARAQTKIGRASRREREQEPAETGKVETQDERQR